MSVRRLLVLYGGAMAAVGALAVVPAFMSDGEAVPAFVPDPSDTVLGSPAAPIVAAFLSLGCLHCRRWEREQMPLMQPAIRRGEVCLALRDHPLDVMSLRGAAFLRGLGADVRQSARERMLEEGVPSVLDRAASAGQDSPERRAYQGIEAESRAAAETRARDAARYGIRATPSFVTAGRLVLGERSADSLLRLALG